MKHYYSLLLISLVLATVLVQAEEEDLPVADLRCGKVMSEPVKYDLVVDQDAEAFVQLSWQSENVKLSLELLDPDGSASKPLEMEVNSTARMYIIEEAAIGKWTIVVKALEVGTDGESFCLLTWTDTSEPVESGAAFNDLISNRGIDDNSDGLYESVEVIVGVSVTVPGEYTMIGELGSNDSILIAEVTDYLDLGAQTMTLVFAAIPLEGRFAVSNLTLSDDMGEVVDFKAVAYTSGRYTDLSQNPQMASLSGEFRESTVDTNGNGLYDILSVAAGINVSMAGEYSLEATLVDEAGRKVGWTMGSADLSPGEQMLNLDFDGKSIWTAGIDGPYALRDLKLIGKDMNALDASSGGWTTRDYQADQFEDPVYPEKVISGQGEGEILVTLVARDWAPVFSGRYSYDMIGINIPPLSTPFSVLGSEEGYAYQLDGAYMPNKPNNFTVSANGVKTLNIGLQKQQNANLTRTWMTSQIKALNGSASSVTDLLSPGPYHVKLFGEAAENSTSVELVMTAEKKVVIDGAFSLAMNTTGLPEANYTIRVEAQNGSLQLDSLVLQGVSI